MRPRILLYCLISFCAGLLTACNPEPEAVWPRFTASPPSATPVYRLAVHPLHNPGKLFQTYQPLVDHLNAHLQGAQLTLEASRNYASYEKKYQAHRPELLLPNPLQTLKAVQEGYHVIAMAGEPGDFKGLILARKDSGLTQPADLKGKAVSYPSPTALAACIMPQSFFHDHGLDIRTDITNNYVGSQESSIMNVYRGHTAAGATWPPPWRAFQKDHPREAAELQVMWETEPLINNSVMIRNDLPAGVETQIRSLLLGLNSTPEGKAILAGMETARFLPASDNDYSVVRDYMTHFEDHVRPRE